MQFWFRLIVLGLLLVLVACVGGENSAEMTSQPLPTTAPTPATTLVIQPDDGATVEIKQPQSATFDGEQALVYLNEQMAFGPRYPGSAGHLQLREYIVDSLDELGWAVERQNFGYQAFDAMNIIGRGNVGKGDIIMLAAHYDTRARADQSPGQEHIPVPGAVDGASGVAVLLEFARTLNLDAIDAEIWLTFFDVEDNGSNGIAGWDWIAGSTYMAENLTEKPTAMVLVDMIGDSSQQLYYERNSDVALREEIWQIAAELGFSEQFIAQEKYTMIDDHVPFLRQGIPAIDIIDFDYPFWHTVEDTADKVSADSLYRVGRTLQVWLEERR